MALPANVKNLLALILGLPLLALAYDFSPYLERQGMEQVYWAYTSPIWYKP